MAGRLGVAVVCWVLLAAAVGGVVATPAGVAGSATATGGGQLVPETDSTVTRIEVAPDGTAAWQVQVLTRLENDAEVAEYETFQDRFRDNRSAFLDPFRDRLVGVVAGAENATGRPMAARDFRVGTDIQTVPRVWGVITYEFRWVGFAEQDGDALAVGDVFAGEFYLTQNDTLAVAGPEGYAATATDPQPAEQRDRTVRWFGRRAFPDETPAVRFEPVTTATGNPATAEGGTARPPRTGDGSAGPGDGATPGTGTPATPSGSSGSSLPIAVAVLLVGLTSIGAYRYVFDSDDGDVAASAPPPEDLPTGKGSAGEQATGESDTVNSDSDGPGDTSTGGSSDDPLVTDADRVEQLLEAEGGRLKQTEVVEAFGWSKSKTSRVLSDMADKERVEKLRIGRENVISLPDSADGADEGE